MSTKRKTYNAVFKAKVALETYKGDTLRLPKKCL